MLIEKYRNKIQDLLEERKKYLPFRDDTNSKEYFELENIENQITLITEFIIDLKDYNIGR